MPRSRPTTPVRRVSRGSISSHHRASVSGNHVLGTSSNNNSTSVGPNGGGGGNQSNTSTPLSFLTQAMADLSYETATLQSNLESIDEIQGALHTFDESFATFLYGLKMNAFCVEWPEAPGEENFERAEERKLAMSDTIRIGQRLSFAASTAGGGGEDASSYIYDTTTTLPADQTYMTQEDDAELMNRKPTLSSAQQKQPIKPALKSAMKKPATVTTAASVKPTTGRTIQRPQQRQQTQSRTASASIGPTAAAAPVKAKITAAEKKKREKAAEEVIETLPLDYRGGDPSAKQLAMRVILALIAGGQKGIRINEIVKSPELPQAKVNKCLIALVGAKQVLRRSDNGVVYHLDPEKHPIAAN